MCVKAKEQKQDRIEKIKKLLTENLVPAELDGYTWRWFLNYDIGDLCWSWRSEVLNTCGMPYFEKMSPEVYQKLNDWAVTPKELAQAFVSLGWVY